ncbi:iron-sulfur cluster biosynthesis family protein [Heyndrickxia ginsengihumi]|uniref:Iron-sulfur cluster biosynthesis family protein n=1 Tax=Heyndrickxia ginsengihumi TaxID=363870 RepID=A0A0A6Y165_9BACI|nr:iron-sulfur cluster biosynthesis family protein [Heyndrickxia ginsengihumi]KHD86037.1 hypothetical protein NG54_05265 [Heyndrickxia ginsengihumi]MBE6185331.1 iron-sulfur cluster biosynthesis family protein [Bacillus sp. (in: firmicutes)]MCM3023692.1 iron-sulfur cluster biosynthesis family protein [Heyndrickxia ginsengihumi]NEY19856.1 iron-sulfur cluster biosynthesis family protein [Heyndrickxia ginsengihumi]
MISISSAAERKLKEDILQENSILKLHYDTEGCGCGLDGIPELILIQKNELTTYDRIIDTNCLPVAIENSQFIFFDDQLTIDYAKDTDTFQLKSPSQILNNSISIRKQP